MATFNNGEAGLSVRTKLNNVLQHADGTTSTLTFNDAGADVDVRIEGVGQTHAFFLDGGTSNIGIGTATASSKLTVAGDSNVAGVATAIAMRDSTTRRIVSPGGGSYNTSTSTLTGAIAITLPVGYTNHMSKFTIKVFEYATQESFDVVVSGYNYTVAPGWINCSAHIISNNATDRDFTVRFGFNATSSKCVVYIGELTSTWSIPQINITDVQLGFTSTGLDDWDTGWAIGFEASAFQNVTATLTNNRVGARLTGAGQTTAALTDAGARSDLLRLSSSGTTGGAGGGVVFASQQADTVNSLGMAAIKGILTSGGTNTQGDLAFSTRNAVTDTNLTERMRLTSAGNLGIGTTSPGAKLDVRGAALGGTATNSSLVTNFGTADANASSLRVLNYRHTTGADHTTGEMRLQKRVDAIDFGYIGFRHNAITFGTTAEQMRIDSTGKLFINRTDIISGSSSLLNITHSGGNNYGIMLQNDSTASSSALTFVNSSGTVVGSVGVTTTATAYNTASDYRLKENIQPLSNSLAKVASLKPVNFSWKSTGEKTDGFIAHELQEVVAQAVTGQKDELDEEGNPRYQSVDHSKLVPLLTSALQEALARIESLEARLAAAGI